MNGRMQFTIRLNGPKGKESKDSAPPAPGNAGNAGSTKASNVVERVGVQPQKKDGPCHGALPPALLGAYKAPPKAPPQASSAPPGVWQPQQAPRLAYPEGTKGLENRTNTFHCFMNVCLQGCLHLKQLRKGIIEAGHRCLLQEPGAEAAGKKCLLCEVRYIVESAPRTEGTYLKPDLVRVALRCSNPSLQENAMADAVETFSTICEEMTRSVRENSEIDPFLRILPPSPYILNAFEFLYTAAAPGSTRPCFSALLKQACSLSLEQITPDTLRYTPEIFPYHVAWRVYPTVPDDCSSDPLRDDIRTFCMNLGMQVNLHITHDLPRLPNTPPRTSTLRGFLAYYPGMHYTSFFKLPSGVWAHFDDRNVRSLSSSWADIVEFMVKGKHMPVMLFYETDDVEPPPPPAGPESFDDDEWTNVTPEEGKEAPGRGSDGEAAPVAAEEAPPAEEKPAPAKGWLSSYF
ncbi:hypothetical protein DIPPA_02409 [Diplonema papillatum]|nr:hypothetical protein DIPPA_02409 [Diplonema papillatum]